MLRKELVELVQDEPIIPGVKDDTGLSDVLTLENRIVFVLFGDILNLQSIVSRLKAAGKLVFVNVDLIEGFSSKDIVVRYLRLHTEADGILSAKVSMIKAAQRLGMGTIYRFFMLDSFSFYNLPKQLESFEPDLVEIIPGCMPRVISWTCEAIKVPLLAGGLVCDKTDAMAALNAGAIAITSTNQKLWRM